MKTQAHNTQPTSAVMIQPGHECFELFPGIEKVQAKSEVSGIFQPRNQNSIFFNQVRLNDEKIS